MIHDILSLLPLPFNHFSWVTFYIQSFNVRSFNATTFILCMDILCTVIPCLVILSTASFYYRLFQIRLFYRHFLLGHSTFVPSTHCHYMISHSTSEDFIFGDAMFGQSTSFGHSPYNDNMISLRLFII